MKASATISADRVMIPLGGLVTTQGDDAESDTLFLESLVAEANRTLDSLRAIHVLVAGQQEATSVCVNYRGSDREICTLSGEEIVDLADKVRQLKGLLHGGAGAA